MARPKVKKWPRIRKRKNQGGSVSYLVDLSTATSRQRKFFTTLEEAEVFAEQKRIERENHGTSTFALPESIKAEASRNWERLKQVGASITEATDFFLKHAKPEAGERLVEDVIVEMLAKRTAAGRSKGYLQVQKSVLGTFSKAFGKKNVHLIMSKDIEEWLAGNPQWSPRTRRNYQKDLSTLWNYALKHRYASHNPLLRLEAPSVPNDPPGILTIKQARSLLRKASSHVEDGLVAYIAIGLFAGLRPAEIERLDWSEVNLTTRLIEVTARKAKTRQRRHATISDNLLVWLKTIPAGERTGRLVRSGTPYKEVVELAKVGGVSTWPHNALRHSFASYHLGKHKDAARTALELGHANQDLLFRNYRELVTPADAIAYWKIKPSQKH